MIKILVDSASDIDARDAAALGIDFIPMFIRFGDTEYADGVNLSHEEFFEKLIESDEMPQTSQINEYRFEEKFAELTADGSDVIAITLSSKLSGTYNNACAAASKFNGKVRVVDSLNASAGERMLFEYALRLIKDGETNVNKLADILDEKKHKICFLALLGTLEYLKKGGRISAAVAFAGEVFSIKPVISITDGEVKLVGKAMGSKRGSNLLTQFIDKYGVDFDMPYVLVYSGTDVALLDKYVNDSAHLWKDKTDKLHKYMIGSTIGTHVGPNAIGVAFFAK
ncbi:MAG: DegV family protein [Clostridiales bacterium]|nr:DegV family protein [Clostridiales bacterium]